MMQHQRPAGTEQLTLFGKVCGMQLLKKWINPVQNGLVGLDIGSGAVKLLSLRSTSSGWTATCAAWAEIEPSDDKAIRHANTLEAIRACLSQTAAGAGTYAVCGLSGPDAAVRGFTFPTLPSEAVEQAVHFEAQQVCPMDMHRSVLDYQMLLPCASASEAAPKQSGVMVAGTEQAISERCRLVKEAGAKTALMDADGLAALNCLSELEDLSVYRTVALIDLGRSYTNIIMLGDNGLPFVRDLNTGSEALIALVAEKTSRDADAVRQMMWAADKETLPDDVMVAFHHAARPLVMNINETLKYYASQEKSPFAEKVFLCGSVAQVHPLAELLSDALPTDVTVFDPFAAIRVAPSITGAELLKTRGPAFVVAAGLAMRTV